MCKMNSFVKETVIPRIYDLVKESPICLGHFKYSLYEKEYNKEKLFDDANEALKFFVDNIDELEAWGKWCDDNHDGLDIELGYFKHRCNSVLATYFRHKVIDVINNCKTVQDVFTLDNAINPNKTYKSKDFIVIDYTKDIADSIVKELNEALK